MKKLALTTAAALGALALSGTAHAGNAEGKWQVKVLATGVLPDGKVDTGSPAFGLPAGADTKANDNVVPTLAVEYFFTPNVSAETICCFTGHHVSVVSGGATVIEHAIDHVLVLPATLTLKFHLPVGPVKPYVGAGITEFFFLGEHAGSDLPANYSAHLDNAFGGVVQAGLDMPINKSGMSLSVDAKRYFVRPRSHFYNGAGTEVISAKHKLDPWVISAGVAYRF